MAAQLPAQFGPYSLLKLLAKGGMGEIYLARTSGISHFEKYYAVKKLLKKFARDQDVGARFIDEAKLGARLQHPNIVQVYDLGAVSEELYMATEFVDGFDLRRVLRFCHEKKKRIPLDIALFIVKELLSGLAYAHRQLDAEGQSINLIHRDISPQNVLVSFEGEVKIIDFGLAKSTQRSQETQANVLLGNFGYMSPEQARGQKLDVRTDIYSTGIVLFELVTRTKRFVDENPLRLLEMVARPTPVMPSDRAPDIPKRIDTIYAKATAPAREDRYEDADAFRSDVTTALHKLNPHASREHLAQFLNHLFLGGKPPPAPDNDALDKSVAMQVHEIYQQAEAFRRTKEQDAQDRRLSQFSDDAPQTASHNLMRGCRAGDTLSHADLTGDATPEDYPAPVQSGEYPSPASAALAREYEERQRQEPQAAPPPPEPPPPPPLHVNEASPPTMQAAPTNVYEAPDWAGQPSAEALPPDDLQAQLQAQLDAQIVSQGSPPAPAGMPQHDTLQAMPSHEEFGAHIAVTSPGGTEHDVFAESPPLELPPEALLPADEPLTEPVQPLAEQMLSELPAAASIDPASRPPSVDPASRPPVATVDPASRPPDPSALSGAGGGAVVSTVGPGHDDEAEEPTVVVDMDSMAQPASQPSASAAMPPPSAATPPAASNPAMPQQRPATGAHLNAFAHTDSSESLIIDFDGGDSDEGQTTRNPPSPLGPTLDQEEAPVRPAPAPQDGAPIRPAATPQRRVKGRPVRDISPRKPPRG